MPGVYREKECPNCGVFHRKKGNYCSKPCSTTSVNKTREISDKARDNIRKAVQAHHDYSLEGTGQKELVRRGLSTNHDDVQIQIPHIHSIDDYDFLENYPRSDI